MSSLFKKPALPRRMFRSSHKSDYRNESSKANANHDLSQMHSPHTSAKLPKSKTLFSAGSFARSTTNLHTSAMGQSFSNLRHTHLCPHCNKDFPNLSSLNKHLTSHSQDRPHECIVCNKRFKRFDHLTSHMLTHRGEKPFQCTLEMCQKRYSDQRSLRRHMEKNHPNMDNRADPNYNIKKWPNQSDAQSTHNLHSHSPPLPSSDHAPLSEMGHPWQNNGFSHGEETSSPAPRKAKRSFWSRLRKSSRKPMWNERASMSTASLHGNGRGSIRPDGPIMTNHVNGNDGLGGHEYPAGAQLRNDLGPMSKCQGELVWTPSTVAEDDQVDDFVKFAGSMAAFGGGWSPEYALSVLHKHGGHVKTALGILLMPTKKTKRMERETVQRWTEAEKKAFEEGFRELGKQFHLVHRYVRTKTTAQIIQYYYKWKKQEPEKYLQYKAAHSVQTAPQPQSQCLSPPQPSEHTERQVRVQQSPMEMSTNGRTWLMPSCGGRTPPRTGPALPPIGPYLPALHVRT